MPQVAMGSGRMLRGTVTAAAADHLTLKTEAGETFTVVLTPNTQLRHGRDAMRPAEVHAGDGIGAGGELDRPNHTLHALFVQIVSAEEVRKAREALGKTWIAGTVTAIHEVKLTILRPDKVSQTIQVDEDTSFKRGGRNLGAMMQGSGELGGGYGGRGGRESAGEGAAQPAVAESITLGDVKVGDSVAGPGALKAGVFTPTQLLVGDPQRRRHAEAAAGAGGAEPR